MRYQHVATASKFSPYSESSQVIFTLRPIHHLPEAKLATLNVVKPQEEYPVMPNEP